MRDIAVTGKTRVCGVIGDPIEHTMSPVMQNAAFRETELDYIYTAFRVPAQGLKAAIDGMRALNIRGLNVTIPHKVAVIPMLDRLDPLAERIGAVNTILNEEGTLTGYNTDAIGFRRAMVDKGTDPAGKNVLVIGAGGAARAIAFALAEDRASITILNRQEELDWAEAIATRISDSYEVPVFAAVLNRQNLEQFVPLSDIIVNATSLGMTPNARATPVPADLLCSGQLVFDIVYNPYETRLLREAKANGAKTLDGLEMLVWQGALAFQLWTGQSAPVDVMRQAAIKVLSREK